MRLTESEFRALVGSKRAEAMLGAPAQKKRQPRIDPLCWGTKPLAGCRIAFGPPNTGFIASEPIPPIPGITMGYRLTLPLSPTKNHEPSNVFEQRTLRNHWANLAVCAWIAAGRPCFARVEITLRFFCRRGRDRDNCYGQALKGIFDGLKGRLMPDDREDLLKTSEEFIYDQPRREWRLELLIRGACDA